MQARGEPPGLGEGVLGRAVFQATPSGSPPPQQACFVLQKQEVSFEHSNPSDLVQKPGRSVCGEIVGGVTQHPSDSPTTSAWGRL